MSFSIHTCKNCAGIWDDNDPLPVCAAEYAAPHGKCVPGGTPRKNTYRCLYCYRVWAGLDPTPTCPRSITTPQGKCVPAPTVGVGVTVELEDKCDILVPPVLDLPPDSNTTPSLLALQIVRHIAELDEHYENVEEAPTSLTEPLRRTYTLNNWLTPLVVSYGANKRSHRFCAGDLIINAISLRGFCVAHKNRLGVVSHPKTLTFTEPTLTPDSIESTYEDIFASLENWATLQDYINRTERNRKLLAELSSEDVLRLAYACKLPSNAPNVHNILAWEKALLYVTVEKYWSKDEGVQVDTRTESVD